jgi:hypothetical protein
VRPGSVVTSFDAHQVAEQPLKGWGANDLGVMIDEGRRQSDRQLQGLEEIRGRAQWLFTVGAPIVVAIAAVLNSFDSGDSGWWVVVWLVSLIAAGYGVVGAAAIMTVRADFDVIDTAVLSGYPPPVMAQLAGDYAGIVRKGENTVATRLTIYRQAVVWLIIGAYGALVTWLAVS